MAANCPHCLAGLSVPTTDGTCPECGLTVEPQPASTNGPSAESRTPSGRVYPIVLEWE